jgi:hypothetical protein
MESLKIKIKKFFFITYFPFCYSFLILLLISHFVTHFPFSIKIKKNDVDRIILYPGLEGSGSQHLGCQPESIYLMYILNVYT